MKLIFLYILILISFIVKSQNDIIFDEYEDSLVSGFNMLFENDGIKFTKTDAEKDTINKQLQEYFYTALKEKNSFNYSFDSINNIGIIISPDKKLRLITWNIKYSNGEYKFFGFIQHINKRKKRTNTFKFVDESDRMPNPEMLSLYHNHWYGALYYKIIEVKGKGRKYYTLLGWDGNNYLSQKKIIEVLYFSGSGKPKFGKTIFRFNKEKRKSKRIIFEYNAQIVMGLNYDNRYKKIVFDHLRPSPKTMKDNYEFYVTDGSYDALEFSMGKWRLIEVFDAQNEKPKNKKEKIIVPAHKKDIYNPKKKNE